MHQKIRSMVVSLEVSLLRPNSYTWRQKDVSLFNFSGYQIRDENTPYYLSSMQSLSHLLFAPPMAWKNAGDGMMKGAERAPMVSSRIRNNFGDPHRHWRNPWLSLCIWNYFLLDLARAKVNSKSRQNLVKVSIRIRAPKEDVIKDTK